MRRARLHLQSEISSPSVERSGQTPGNFQPLLFIEGGGYDYHNIWSVECLHVDSPSCS